MFWFTMVKKQLFQFQKGVWKTKMDFNKHGGGNKQGVLTFFRRSIDEEKGNVSGGWKKSKINK